jgi:nucleotide-binding universal stress UspA family protein/tellurite resistance protein/uncharacterized protein (DUF697 family)
MKVLVAADISPTTLQICEFLQNYLKPLAGEALEVTILHIYEPELDYSEDAPGQHQNWQAVPTSESELRHIFAPLEAICTLNYVVIDEAIGDSILRRSALVDLIVMGRRRRGQMQEMVTGSLSQFVLHRATCPVLIVPEPTSRQLAYKMLQSQSAQTMPLMSAESLARLKVLIAVAQSDGAIDAAEQQWLESSLQQEGLPAGVTWEQLLGEPIDLVAALKEITDPAQQELTYYAAYRLANADAEYSPEEQAVIDKIAASFGIIPTKVTQLQELVDQSAGTGSSKTKPIDDPELRRKAIAQRIQRYANATAVLGAFPSPLLSFYTQSAALGLQTTLMAEIAAIWGEPEFAVQPFFQEMVGSLGLVSAWLMALDVAKLVPKVGKSLGSTDAFTATWAMGQTSDAYFASGQTLSRTELRQMFRQIRKSAEATYDQNEATIGELQQEHTGQIKSLTDGLRSGKLTIDSYQKRLQQMLLVTKQPGVLPGILAGALPS